MWGITPERRGGLANMRDNVHCNMKRRQEKWNENKIAQHTAASNGRLDQRVKLLITTNGQLQMAGSDTLDLQILGGIASKLENLGNRE